MSVEVPSESSVLHMQPVPPGTEPAAAAPEPTAETSADPGEFTESNEEAQTCWKLHIKDILPI